MNYQYIHDLRRTIIVKWQYAFLFFYVLLPNIMGRVSFNHFAKLSIVLSLILLYFVIKIHVYSELENYKIRWLIDSAFFLLGQMILYYVDPFYHDGITSLTIVNLGSAAISFSPTILNTNRLKNLFKFN